MKKLLHTLNTSKNAKWFLLGGVAVIAAIIVLLVIAPWKSDAAPPDDDGSPVVEQTPDPTETPPADTTHEETPSQPTDDPQPTPRPPSNPLTGVTVNAAGEIWTEEMNRNRPWAVTIGNYDISQPMWGLSDADMLLEFEFGAGGQTRLIAFYQEIEHVGQIGGIRSLRSSSMELARSFDAIFVHWGGRTYNDKAVGGSPISEHDTYNAETRGIGYRADSSKIYEHRAAVTGQLLIDGTPESFRTEHTAGFNQSFLFTDDGTPTGGVDATNVTVSFADGVQKRTIFTYNEGDGLYYVQQKFSQSGSPVNFIDGNNNEELSFTNILVVQMPMSRFYNRVGHTRIDTTTSGQRPAYYINGGQCIKIYYEHENIDDPIAFFTEDGTPLEMGVGRTYICIVDYKEDSFEPLSFD